MLVLKWGFHMMTTAVICETEYECDYWFTYFSGKATVLLFLLLFPVKKLHDTIGPFEPIFLSSSRLPRWVMVIGCG